MSQKINQFKTAVKKPTFEKRLYGLVIDNKHDNSRISHIESKKEKISFQ